MGRRRSERLALGALLSQYLNRQIGLSTPNQPRKTHIGVARLGSIQRLGLHLLSAHTNDILVVNQQMGLINSNYPVVKQENTYSRSNVSDIYQ